MTQPCPDAHALTVTSMIQPCPDAHALTPTIATSTTRRRLSFSMMPSSVLLVAAGLCRHALQPTRVSEGTDPWVCHVYAVEYKWRTVFGYIYLTLGFVSLYKVYDGDPM